MNVLVYGSPSGTALYACKKHGLQPLSIPYHASTLDDMMFGAGFDFPVYESQSIDILVTSGEATKVRTLVKTLKPPMILWDLGPRPATKKHANAALVPLQILGYKVILVTGMSSHLVGYNYIENRTILIAELSKEPNILPSKIKLSRPFASLSTLIRADSDPFLVPVFSGSTLFHEETRPWSFVSRPKGGTHLLSHPLSTKVGAVWYDIGGKLHRLNVSEAAGIVGYPLEAQMKLTTLCEDWGMSVNCILRDLSYPLWLDIFERTLS